MRKPVLLILIAVAAACIPLGCNYPAPARIESQDLRPTIAVRNAPRGSVLIVDGLEMGPARQYDGERQSLLVESGTHRIEVVARNGTVILSEEVFLGNSTHREFDASVR